MATSPCIGVCKLDSATQTCTGCRRTIGEITAWPRLSEAERLAIMARLSHPQAATGTGKKPTPK